MRGKGVVISVAAVLAGAGGGALSLHWKSRPAPPAPKSGMSQIDATPEVTLSGKLRAQHIITVKAEIEGDIDSFIVDVGEAVFAGEVLAQIGVSGLENQRGAAATAVMAAERQVSKAESNVANARLEASRADADRQRSHTALDKAQAVYDRQEMLNQA